MSDVTYVGIGTITKRSRRDDGTLDFEAARATSSDLDSDHQIADPEWAKTAMADWFKSGANLREMHRPIAAGRGLTLESRPDGEYVSGRVVDPGSVRKVENDVLTGLSIGIANPRIVKDATARNGRIVGGRIVEVSLVDRPANPTCKLALAKAAGDSGDAEFVEEYSMDPGALEDAVEKGELTADAARDRVPDGLDAPAFLAKGDAPFGGKKAPPFKSGDKNPAKDEKKPAADDEDDEDDEAKDEKPGKGKPPWLKADGTTDLGALVAGADGFDELTEAISKAALAKYTRAYLEDLAGDAGLQKADAPELTKDDAGGLQLTDAMAAVAELGDIAVAKNVLAGLATLIRSEALGVMAGDLGDVVDIGSLAQAMAIVKCFLESEGREVTDLMPAAQTVPPEPPPLGGATREVAPPAHGPEEPDMTLADQIEQQYQETLTKARAALAGDSDATTAPEAEQVPETLTKADITTTVTEALGALDGTITKAMEPLLGRLAQVEAANEQLREQLAVTPRGGGPAVTAVVKSSQADRDTDAVRRDLAVKAQAARARGETVLAAGYEQRIEKLAG